MLSMALFLSESSESQLLNSRRSSLPASFARSSLKCFKDSSSSGPAMLTISFISLNSFAILRNGSAADLRSFKFLITSLARASSFQKSEPDISASSSFILLSLRSTSKITSQVTQLLFNRLDSFLQFFYHLDADLLFFSFNDYNNPNGFKSTPSRSKPLEPAIF